MWDNLRECHRRMRSELRAVVVRHGIYLSEYRALARLREGNRTLSQLAEALGLTPASMTDLADQLVRRRWAERLAHPTDGRSRILQITESGERTHAAARREYRARLAEVYRALSPETRRRLTEDLEDLGRVLASRMPARGPGSSDRNATRSPRRGAAVRSVRAGRTAGASA